MSGYQRNVILAGCSALLVLAAAGQWSAAEQATGKTKGKPKSGSGSIKALDARVEKLGNTLFREIVDISKQYEDAGQFDRAKSLLDLMLKLNPEMPGLQEKLVELEEKIFDAQEVEFVLDTSKSWVPIGANAARGKNVRVEIDGDYKFQYSGTLTADGITSVEAGQEYIENIPMGALMAVVVHNGKPGRAVPLHAKMQWTPQEDGMVMLKINAPAGHKCTGKLTVKLSGLVRGE